MVKDDALLVPLSTGSAQRDLLAHSHVARRPARGGAAKARRGDGKRAFLVAGHARWPCGTRRTSGTCRSRRACRANGPCRACVALRAFRSCGPWRACRTRWPWVALRPLRSCWAWFPLFALRAGRAFGATTTCKDLCLKCRKPSRPHARRQARRRLGNGVQYWRWGERFGHVSVPAPHCRALGERCSFLLVMCGTAYWPA